MSYYFSLCRENGLSEACVTLSALLGLWESALELSLQVDVSLAKSVAAMPEDVSLQKRLWLGVGESQNISYLLSILSLFIQFVSLILDFFVYCSIISHIKNTDC